MFLTLFIGNMESPYIVEVLETLLLSGKNLIMSDSSLKAFRHFYSDERLSNRIRTWSWKEEFASVDTKSKILGLAPYLYPDTINTTVLHDLFNVSPCSKHSFGNFRLGFGVQEELFDLFLADFLGVGELAYFDIITSLQLLNPVYQFEYRKKSYEYLHYISKETLPLAKQKMVVKKYSLIYPIPFYESFSYKFNWPGYISHYTIENK